MAERDHAGARQGRDVDDGVGAEFLRVRERIAQDQAAFGVGVEDLDRLARHRGDDVAGARGRSVRHVFAGRHDADDIDGRAHAGERADRAQDAARAGHVELHLVHFGAALERYAAGIEGDALADQHQGLFRLGRAGVAQHDQLGRLARAGADRQQRAHAQALHVLALEHFDAELELLRDLSRFIGKVGRRAHVGRQVAERAREVRAIGGRHRFLERGLRLESHRSTGNRERQGGERGRGGFLQRLELVEAVERLAHAKDRVAHGPGQAAAADCEIRHRQNGVARPEALQRRGGAAQRLAELRDAVFTALPEADEENALGGKSGSAMQQQRGAGLAGEVAAGQHPAQCAARRLVRGLRGAREAAT